MGRDVPLLRMWLIFPYFLWKGVDEFSDLCIGKEGGRGVLDGSVDDLLGEVICTYVARDSDDVSSSGFDVVYDGV
jgi:hypothetical protein